jgi:predicted aldo/keto reductase-like oxidoreductase
MSDPDRIFAEGGAFDALIEAKKAGKVRYVGFTGHKSPDIHLKMLEAAFNRGFTFDTVQMPLNVMDAHYESFEKKVLPVLLKHRIGVLGMKPMGDKFIIQSGKASPVECLQYALSLPTSVVITGCDSLRILQQAVSIARGFRPLSEKEISALLARTSDTAKEGSTELYKTSDNFDGTARNPGWLGPPASEKAA